MPGTRIALLLSVYSFEEFFEGERGLTVEQFLSGYRNDFAWEYMAGMRAESLEPLLYVISTQRDSVYRTPDGYTVRFVPVGRAWAVWRAIYPLRLSALGQYASELVNTLSFRRALQRALADDGIDVLYIQELWTARFDLLVRSVDVPVIAGEHGGSEGRLVRLGKRASFGRAYRITVQSKRQLELLNGRYGAPVERLTNAVDSDFYSPDPAVERDPRSLLTVARIVDGQKRISDLIQALAKLPPEWRLEIVGSGPDETALRRLSHRLGVTERVTWAGFVADKEELRDRYRRCGVYAQPSKFEAMALTVLEAMSCAAAPVVSRLPTFTDLIDHDVNGLIVDVGDPAALARAIERAGEEPERIGAAARSTIEASYDRSRTMRRLADIVKAAAASRALR